MNKIFVLLLSCFSIALPLSADYYGSYEGCANCFGFESVLAFDVGGGYRSDNLKWKRYPAPTEEVNEQWRNIGMGVAETNVYFLACERYLFTAGFDCAWFSKSGHQTYEAFDSDILDQRLSSRTKGQAYNLSGAIGYQFNFCSSRLSLAPLVGYSYNYQRFKNNQYENELDPSAAEVTYHDRYKYRWNGPTVGGTIACQPFCDLLLYFDYTFHWTKLRANIDEKFTPELVDDTVILVSSNRPARIKSQSAYGNEYTVGADYVFCDGWFMGAKFNYKQFWASKAHYHIDDQEGHSPVHDLSWNSYNITLNIGYNF